MTRPSISSTAANSASSPAPIAFAPCFLRLGDDQLPLRPGAVKQLRRTPRKGKHSLLALAGSIVLLLLREHTGDLLKRQLRRGNARFCLLCRLNLRADFLFSLFKDGDCVHGFLRLML